MKGSYGTEIANGQNKIVKRTEKINVSKIKKDMRKDRWRFDVRVFHHYCKALVTSWEDGESTKYHCQNLTNLGLPYKSHLAY